MLAVRWVLEAGRMVGWGARRGVSGHARQSRREQKSTSSLRARPCVSFQAPEDWLGQGQGKPANPDPMQALTWGQ